MVAKALWELPLNCNSYPFSLLLLQKNRLLPDSFQFPVLAKNILDQCCLDLWCRSFSTSCLCSRTHWKQFNASEYYYSCIYYSCPATYWETSDTCQHIRSWDTNQFNYRLLRGSLRAALIACKLWLDKSIVSCDHRRYRKPPWYLSSDVSRSTIK